MGFQIKWFILLALKPDKSINSSEIVKILILNLLLCLSAFSGWAQDLTIFRSDYSVEETSTALIDKINQLNLIYFESIDHQKIAQSKGFEIPPTTSILFEEPSLVSQLLLCAPTTALDLPLEILVWEERGDVYMGYIDPKFMDRRFMINGCEETLSDMSKLMIRITTDVTRSLRE